MIEPPVIVFTLDQRLKTQEKKPFYVWYENQEINLARLTAQEPGLSTTIPMVNPMPTTANPF